MSAPGLPPPEAQNHLMIDIEALSCRPGGAVIQLAAKTFNPWTDAAGPSFDVHIKEAFPFTIDPSTLAWHHEQGTYPPPEDTPRRHPRIAVLRFKEWLTGIERLAPIDAWWAWGATYDFPLLTALYDSYSLSTPWAYWQARCARTVFHSLLPNEKPTPKPHDAAQDCLIQIRDLQRAFKAIRA